MVEIMSVKGVQFKFDNKATSLVIQDISFSVEEYEFVSVISPSGAGKSTLLRIMAGLIRPTAGQVLYYDKEVTEPIPDVSFVFQDSALLPWLTNVDNVKLGLSAMDISKEEKTKKAVAILDRMDLNGFEYSYPNVLSGGMKQRVGVARALVSDPKVLLMDEPFSSLDELTARSLRAEILQTLKNKSLPLKSVIMVTHNVEEAVELSDRIVVLSNKPSTVKAIKTVELPMPRNRHDSGLQNTVDEVYALLTT